MVLHATNKIVISTDRQMPCDVYRRTKELRAEFCGKMQIVSWFLGYRQCFIDVMHILIIFFSFHLYQWQILVLTTEIKIIA